MEDGVLATPRARYLFACTARMLEQVEATSAPAPLAVPEPPPDPSAPRPRREIIAEEMAADRAFALALVHQQVDLDDALEAHEAAFEQAVRDAAPGARVERFGEMTFGVFVRGPVEAVEQWVGEAHAHLARDARGPVSIGAAYLHEHHETPDALRTDATDALQDSFESGQPILVG